ncbi:DUF4129 domain-containing protein [Natrinema salaciae]|uniref:Protein-glutamine gamma-glutamyltransferase-like C-terminal domain-containing protein n=1 Tax=Natrinema salaciae TaxID=1186196 RepID=A0A1H9MXD8_9EURY|nr:DUF4129 domain-containing protein [Natrinema salaciae]SER28374.1 protein of unknown function [Natrinema salaciae]
MSDDTTTTDETADDAAGGADYRQVSFVALAALALVLAAAFAPGMAGDSGSSPGFDVDWDGGDGNGPEFDLDGRDGGDGGSGDAPDIEFDWRQLLEWFTVDRDDTAVTESDPQCRIMLDREPVPGRQVTAMIRYEGEPLTGTPVWFDEQRVGETDENGRVTGEVPYVKELTIRVGAGTDATCRAGTSTSSSTATKHIASTGLTASVASVASVAPTERTASSAALGAATAQADGSANASRTYPIDATVRLDVDGDPYPGERITVEATIRDEPMREATVAVDGTTVGETDADGRAAVTVPDDGTDSFELEVARGDFAGTTTVDVLALEVAFVPDGIAPIPGSGGAVEASINGTPVEDAQVAVDGEPVGTTNEDGRLAIDLPRDPTATVTVSTERQTASVSLVGEYGAAALVLAVVVAGLAALSYRGYGRRGPIAVLGSAAALVAVLVAEAFYGRVGGLVALGVVALLGLWIARSRSDGGWLDGGVRDLPSIRDRLDRLASWLVAVALRWVDRLEALLERGRALAGAVAEWLRSMPRSGRALRERFADWLRTLPGRARARLVGTIAAAQTLPLRAVAAGLGAVVLIAGGAVVDGVRGAALVTAVLAVAAAVVFRSDETATESTEPAGDEGARADEERTAAGRESDDALSFRELWRSFARRVAPGRWRTSTPGEIERRARADGYPSEPVRELTTLFREVEYGGRPRSRDRRERAADAYDAVERARDATSAEADDEREPASETTEGEP